MGVTAKTYTMEDIKGMDTDGLRAAVPEILKAYNASNAGNPTAPKDIKLWEVYYEAALKIDASNIRTESHTEYREKFAERQISKNTY